MTGGGEILLNPDMRFPAMAAWATSVIGAALILGARDSAAFAPAGIPLRVHGWGGRVAGLSLRRGAAPVAARGRGVARVGRTWVMSGDPGGKRENEDDEAMPLGFRRSDNGTRNSEFDGLMSPGLLLLLYSRYRS